MAISFNKNDPKVRVQFIFDTLTYEFPNFSGVGCYGK
jgi:hypothetical protein